MSKNREYDKMWRDKNKDKIKEYNKKYRKKSYYDKENKKLEEFREKTGIPVNRVRTYSRDVMKDENLKSTVQLLLEIEDYIKKINNNE